LMRRSGVKVEALEEHCVVVWEGIDVVAEL
jgi:hypothetical protein